MDEVDVPSYFLCPISLQIMKDPVTISTGITYDRESIEKWLFSQKNNTCPVTKQKVQENSELIPNHTLRRLIQAWCTVNASYGVERIPTPRPPIDKTQISKLIKDAKTLQLQRKCLQKLRSLASESETNKRAMEAAGVVEFLASLIGNASLQGARMLQSDDNDDDSGMEIRIRLSEEALSILYSLQESESSLKSLMCKNIEFVESLIRVMQCGSYESRAYAVSILQAMFEVTESLQLFSLRHEFFVEIVQVMHDRISHQAVKASLQLLISLCTCGRNRVKAVEAGAVPILIEFLLESPERRVCEMLLLLLDSVCACAEGRAELLNHGAGLAIVSKKILRVSYVASERAMRILMSISKFSATPSVVQDMMHLGVVAKLCLVLQMDGSSRTKEKAKEILKLHAKAWKSSPCMSKNMLALYPS